jgi:hypothetical protein
MDCYWRIRQLLHSWYLDLIRSFVCRKPSTRICVTSCLYNNLRTTVLLVWRGGASDSSYLFYEFWFSGRAPVISGTGDKN